MTEQEVQILIEKVEQADSSFGLFQAVQSLAVSGHEKAIPTLIQALGYNNPGAAVAAVEGLIQMGDVTVSYLLAQIDGYNYGARAWATRALAGIGHPSALAHLQEAAKRDFSMSVRRSAAKGLGNICWHKLPDERVNTAQNQVLETLIEVSHDPEWVVRYAAVVGLQNLGMLTKQTQPKLMDTLVPRLQQMLINEPELGVCARIRLALENLNPKILKTQNSSSGNDSG
ncbi:HEAT repeat domain-containing protein [Crocosphaera sp. UHCC 0190]|uniref:HEAT repeat domain-containing protein n=1 Tax=Crocosphaera sp. UHCC 0190 TaxID=3110246 RepID=UPI002B21EC55|nr:HEAT repeat domain-containing protein [Crocosphaera sp. UHCC 0190]MEA5508249.1 HEAT repeat domain-containing protein [Crocosphaera sp. UHCC 0190]